MGSNTGNDFSDAWGSWSVGGGYPRPPVRFSPLRRKRIGGNCPWTRETVSKWPRPLHPVRRPRRRIAQPAATPAAELPPPTEAPPSDRPLLPRDGMRTACARPSSPPRSRRWAALTSGVARGRMAEDSTAPASSSTPTGSIGVGLPRTSRDQAEGRAIARNNHHSDQVTCSFSNSGGPVTHVGLYHRGRSLHPQREPWVQVSLLTGEDPYRAVVVREMGRGAEVGGAERYLSACCRRVRGSPAIDADTSR